MISVLLLILKIIGIVLLAVLGLILLILLLVLFAPVSYKVWVVHNPKETRVKAKITYLFPLLLATLQYLQKFTCKVRLFGFVLFNSEKPKKENPKKEKTDKKKKLKKKRKKQAEEAVSQNGPQATTVSLPNEETMPASAVSEDAVPCPEPKAEQEKKQSLIEKIKCKFQKIRETISNIISKIKKLLHQKDEAQRILAKQETKQAISFAWDKLKGLLKHVFPRKVKGYVAYGADNPATTGQVLGVLSIIYARTGKLLEIRPNFEEKQLECDVFFKGRIRLFTLLVIGIKVVLNPEVKQLIKEVKELKNIE